MAGQIINCSLDSILSWQQSLPQTECSLRLFHGIVGSHGQHSYLNPTFYLLILSPWKNKEAELEAPFIHSVLGKHAGDVVPSFIQYGVSM